MNLFSKRFMATTMLVIIILTIVGCGKEDNKQPASTDVSKKITIVNLEDDDMEISVDEIKELDKVNRDVISVTSSGEEDEMNISGGLLEELLEKYGKSQKDFSSIRLVAGDGYSVDIPSEILKNREIILTYEVDGEPLLEESQPIMIVIPEERAMYWVKNLEKIEILMDEGESTGEKSANRGIILESTFSDLQEDYKYEASMDKAIKIERLLKEFSPEDLDEGVFIKAVDGLEKNEDNKVFRDAYIKTTGVNSPMFLSPDMPEGMTVKKILWFNLGESSFISVESAIESLGQEDLSQVKLTDLLDEIGLNKGEKYTFTALDEYSVDISQDELESGILYMEEDGKVVVEFTELPKNTSVKDLLYIDVE